MCGIGEGRYSKAQVFDLTSPAEGTGTCPATHGETRRVACPGTAPCAGDGIVDSCDPNTKARTIHVYSEKQTMTDAVLWVQPQTCTGIDTAHWKTLGCDGAGYQINRAVTMYPSINIPTNASTGFTTAGFALGAQGVGSEAMKLEIREGDRVTAQGTVSANAACDKSSRRNSVCALQWDQTAGFINKGYVQQEALRRKGIDQFALAGATHNWFISDGFQIQSDRAAIGDGWAVQDGKEVCPRDSCLSLPPGVAARPAVCMKQTLTGPKVEAWKANERSHPLRGEYGRRVAIWGTAS
jgi:hypothetical protein